MDVESELLNSPASKQKAQMLLKMANAVEDSSTRRRQRLHDEGIDGEAVSQLIDDLEQDLTIGQPKTSRRRASHGDIPNIKSHKRPLEPLGRGSPVQLQQVQLLYTAMIRYRENADLRYQLLELRHLDLSRSFVELETRYRHLETEQEGWKQSCQALQLAATEDGLDASLNRLSGNNSSPNSSALRQGARPGFQKSTIPILQQELSMLSSQRSQLLQANLELRKQLKQMQIQMQTPKAEDSMTATCHRCHPELFAGRQLFAQEAFFSIAEQFHSSSLEMSEHNHNSASHRDTHLENVQEESKEGASDDESESLAGGEDESDQQQHARDEDQHQDKMHLLGMHFTGDTKPAPTPRTIVWSPPPASPKQHRSISPNPKHSYASPKSRMAPTMNSILPMQHHHTNDKQMASRRDNHVNSTEMPPEALQHSFQELDTQVNSKVTPSSFKERQPKNSSTKQEMDRFGMLDEFGRSMSYRLKSKIGGGSNVTDTGNSNHSGSTVPTSNKAVKGIARFRRKSNMNPQQPQPAPVMTTNGQAHHAANRQRRTQRHPIAAVTPPSGTAAPSARHLEYHSELKTRHQSEPPQQQSSSSLLINARHLEFSSAPAQPQPSPTQRGNPRQQHHPARDTSRASTGGGGAPRAMRRQQVQDGKAAMAARTQPTGRHSIHAGGTGAPSSAVSPRRIRSSAGAPQQTRSGTTVGLNGSTPSHRHTPHTPPHPNRSKSSSEPKTERHSRPQSYFERIKKTLQQEI